MRICYLCKTKYPKGSGILFCVPRDEHTRGKWGEICGKIFTANARICDKHFLSSSIINVGGRNSLLPNAEPVYINVHCSEPFMGQCVSTSMEIEDVNPSHGDISIEGTSFMEMVMPED
ncbi:uncharacterized protein LOC124419322 [Lucilia cuprina]|uniref:uncharacterized protein LOC124419322 n=1 Tax=Lucilia cuprina TaxID=7375 RepID=UPI001F06D8FC|nr:uncharacterized protein LOC124419322 [Lucilia cuprina]